MSRPNWAVRAADNIRELMKFVGDTQTFAVLVVEQYGLFLAVTQELEPGQRHFLEKLASPANDVTRALVREGVPVLVRAHNIGLYPMRNNDQEGTVVGALAIYPVTVLEDARERLVALASAFARILGDGLAHQAFVDQITLDRLRAR